MILYVFVLIGAGAVISVYSGTWTRSEEKLVIDDVYYDEEQGWKPLPPEDLPPPLPESFRKEKKS